MHKRILSVFLLALFLTAGFTLPVSAQENDYSIRLRRDFGYGGGVNIRGIFTLRLQGDESVVESVIFLIDGKEIAKVSSLPYQYQFHTDDYGFGVHRLSAKVFLNNDTQRTTPEIQYHFISPRDERKQIVTILVGLGGIILVSLVLAGILQGLLTGGNKKHAVAAGVPRQYGILGGTICPKCGRPFSRHLWGFNLLVGRLDRCEYCGKWVMTVRAAPEALRAAEKDAITVKQSSKMYSSDNSDEMKDRLEDTKYIDIL